VEPFDDAGGNSVHVAFRQAESCLPGGAGVTSASGVSSARAFSRAGASPRLHASISWAGSCRRLSSQLALAAASDTTPARACVCVCVCV
jgi:hypothetical protein